MKKYLAVAAAAFFLLAGAVVFLFLSPRQFAPVPPEAGTEAPRSSESPANAQRSSPSSAASNSAEAISATQTETLADKAGQYIPPADAPTNLPPQMILENMRRIFHQYGAMFGGNPVGTNPEITAALAGKNPKQINFLAGQPGMRIDASGALIDPWGTPYFFHQLSGTIMEIHSAGPDKIMWTSDDLVTQ